jgi:hypothetical protein
MPKLTAPHPANSTVPSSRTDATQRDFATFHQRADALYRCAIECCRQHERLARLVRDGALGAEQRAAESLVALADDALADMAAAYEMAAKRVHAERDSACWRAANALWLASREYASRQRTSSRAIRTLGDGRHSTDRLAELAVDYDLEASALLQLRQATDGYTRIRPQAAA